MRNVRQAPKEERDADRQSPETAAPLKSRAVDSHGQFAEVAPWIVCLALAALVWAVFGQTLRFGFLNYDDNAYVTENARVQAGLSLNNIAWAFTHLDISLWTPVTTLSHMLDCQLFGLGAGGHHCTNILLHTATALLLFLVLRQMTGYPWRSAFVAAVFAIHPLRIESVAWIAERKDVLDGLFFTLTLAAYIHYVRAKRSIRRYLLVILPFGLGLMAKPMVATAPFLLLLLDYWPLHRIRKSNSSVSEPPRFRRESIAFLILEKAPLILIAAACIAATLIATSGGTPPELPTAPLSIRLGNGIAATVVYIRQMLWPTDAALIQSGAAGDVAVGILILCGALLLAISGAVLLFGKRFPYLPVGWFSYLGMLVPVSGIGALGLETRADRYTYLPQIGLYILVTWLIADLSARLTYRNAVLAAAAAAVIVILSGVSYAKVGYWHDSTTLWQHMAMQSRNNVIANEEMGLCLSASGRAAEAIPYYRQAAMICPDYSVAHYNLANALKAYGNLGEAIGEYRLSLQLDPDNADAHDNLGVALKDSGKPGEAIAEYWEALRINPDDAEARNNLGLAFQAEGKLDEAILDYQEALHLKPNNPLTHFNLGTALQAKGNLDGAISQYREAFAIDANYAEAHHNLANVLQIQGKLDDALAEYREALRLKPGSALTCLNIGGLLQSQGKAGEAITYFEKAVLFEPDFDQAQWRLGAALLATGHTDEALQHLDRAVQLHAGNAEAFKEVAALLETHRLYRQAAVYYQRGLAVIPNASELLTNDAWLLATCPDDSVRDGHKAVELAMKARQESADPGVLKVLAAAYAEAGQYAEATTTAQAALKLARDEATAVSLRAAIALYQRQQPFRQP